MRILGFNTSRSTRILWALEEVGAEYEYVEVDRRKRFEHEELMQHSPLAKIPLLIDEDVCLSETIAILTYIGHAYPEMKLVPSANDPKFYQWLSFASFIVTEFEQPLWLKGKHSFVLPEELRTKEILPSIKWEFERYCRVMSDRLGENEYIMGNHFSAADILLAHSLVWAILAKFPVEQANLVRYRKQMIARDARLRAKQRES